MQKQRLAVTSENSLRHDAEFGIMLRIMGFFRIIIRQLMI